MKSISHKLDLSRGKVIGIAVVIPTVFTLSFLLLIRLARKYKVKFNKSLFRTRSAIVHPFIIAPASGSAHFDGETTATVANAVSEEATRSHKELNRVSER